jgi:hypothetical protein
MDSQNKWSIEMRGFMKNRQKSILFSVGFASLIIMACGLSGMIPSAITTSPTQPPAHNQQPAQGGQQPTTIEQPNQGVLQPAPALSEADVYKAVDAAMAKMLASGPRHVSQVSQTNFKGTTTEEGAEADIVPPNLHEILKSKGNMAGEFYVMDGNLYSKNQDGWTQKLGGGQPYLDALNGVPITGPGDITRANGKVAGIETINGKPTLVYNYDSTIKSLKITSNFTLWVDQASGLSVKQESTGAQGSNTVQIITYDSAISLTLPPEAKTAKTIN